MNARFNNSTHFSSIELKPESINEVVALVRTARNAKRKTFTMNVHFNEDGTVTALISIEKKLARHQVNFINNKNEQKH